MIGQAERLVLLGVPEGSNESSWGAQYFAQYKPKTNRLGFLSEFINLNKQLKLKPYPMPYINKIVFKLEAFNYDRLLDLNMGYYHIWPTKDTSKLFTIILPWWKYHY